MPSGDLSELFKRVADGHRNIRFGQGVVGKTGHAMWLLLIVWGVIAWKLSGNPWIDIPLLLVGLGASAGYVWWVKNTHKFAAENPALALLEGMQLVEYRRIEAQAKGMTDVIVTPPVPNPLVAPAKEPLKLPDQTASGAGEGAA